MAHRVLLFGSRNVTALLYEDSELEKKDHYDSWIASKVEEGHTFNAQANRPGSISYKQTVSAFLQVEPKLESCVAEMVVIDHQNAERSAKKLMLLVRTLRCQYSVESNIQLEDKFFISLDLLNLE